MIDIPGELAEARARYDGAAGRAVSAGLPDLAAAVLDRWRPRLDGPSTNGVSAPVRPAAPASVPKGRGELRETAEMRRCFDAMTGVLGLDRERARARTLGRLPRNAPWAWRTAGRSRSGSWSRRAASAPDSDQSLT
ncbi:hypothetical protein ACWGLF_04245 [Streptomyces puniciscabiei]